MTCEECRVLLRTHPTELTNSEVLGVIVHLKGCHNCMAWQQQKSDESVSRMTEEERQYHHSVGHERALKAVQASQSDPELPQVHLRRKQ